MVSRPKSPAGTSVSNSKAVLCAHWRGSRASSVGTRGQNHQADPPTNRTMSVRSPRQLRVDPETHGSTVPEGNTTQPSAAPWALRTRTRRADPSQAVHTHCCPSGLGTDERAPRAALARAHHCPGLEEEARGATQGTGRCRAAAMGHSSRGQENGEDSRRDPTLWAMC